MNEKLTIQDLSAMLISEHLLSKEEAEVFIKEFFLLVENALEKDKYVKIKGLGVFRLIQVEARESVNINTKERFEIPGYTKISFTPDNALRDVINKPFAHFETVVLNENTVFDEKNGGQELQSQVTEESSEARQECYEGLNREPVKSVKDVQAEKKNNIEAHGENLCAKTKHKHKSVVKLHVVLIGLLVVLFCGVSFFVNRYQMASEELEGRSADFEVETETEAENSRIIEADSIGEEIHGNRDSESDTIQMVVSRTSLDGHVEN